MLYVGLDLSLTGSGLVIVDEEGIVIDRGLYGYTLTRKATVRDKIERLLFIVENIIKKVERHGDDVVVGIEGYAYGKFGSQPELGELQGCVKTQLWLALRIVPEVVVVTAARKTVLGKGRFSKGKKGKTEIINAVCERGFDVSDDNVADAYVIAECMRLKGKVKNG